MMAVVKQALLVSAMALCKSLALGSAGLNSFLQIGQNTLPKVSTLIKEPRQVLETLNSQISTLQAGLAEKEQESKQAIEQLKASYESQLNAQANETKIMHRMNKALGEKAAGVRDSNLALREEAKELEAESLKLEADLKVLKINISTAQEFAALAFESSGPLLDNATELKVLAELEDKEAADRDSQIHQERLKEVTRSPSLLQVSAAGTQGPKNPQELLEALMASLSDLSQEQNESEASLKASFEEEFKAGVEKQQALAKKQEEINATIADGEALHEKLLAAVNHLKATRDGLLEKSRSLRGYARKVADAHEFTKAISLLQLAAARHALNDRAPTALPDVSKVLSNTTEAYQSMNSHVDQLEQRLSEVGQQEAANVAKQKAEYEQRLQEQADENAHIKAANLELLTEIKTLQRTSAGLREDAKKQAATNENLRNDLEILQKNVTTAQEFMTMALAKAKDLFNASQLSVLSDLDAADAARAHEAERQYLLKSVAQPRKLGLLELTAAPGAATDPQDMIQQLLVSLGDLAKEQNASTEALKATFEKQFQEGSEHRTRLLEEQAELNEKKKTENVLIERLQAAVKHLKETGSNLKQQNESLRSFLGKFGLRPEAKKQEAKAEVELHAESKQAATQATPKNKTLSLASAGKGQMVEHGSIAISKEQRKQERHAKKMAMQATQAVQKMNVHQFLSEMALVTRVRKVHNGTHAKKETKTKDAKQGAATKKEPAKTGIMQIKHRRNGPEHGTNVKHTKKATPAKDVNKVKVQKEEQAKTYIAQSKHGTGKEHGTNVKHARKATPAKDVNEVQQDEPKEIEGEPAKAKQDEPVNIEVAPPIVEAQSQSETEVMMLKKTEAAPASWLSPVAQKLSWLMR